MRYLKDIILLISLLPFLFTLYLAALNFNKTTNLRILIWESNQIKLGLLIAVGSTLGLSLSSINILLINKSNVFNKNHYKKRIKYSSNYQEESEVYQIPKSNDNDYNTSSEYIERDIRDPIPTVAVPYRIIRDNIKNKFVDNEYKDESTNDAEDLYSKNSSSQFKEDEKLQDDWIKADFEQW